MRSRYSRPRRIRGPNRPSMGSQPSMGVKFPFKGQGRRMRKSREFSESGAGYR